MTVSRDQVVAQLKKLLGTDPDYPVVTGETGWGIVIKFETAGVSFRYGTLAIIPRLDDVVFRFSHNTDRNVDEDNVRPYDFVTIYKYSTISKIDSAEYTETYEHALLIYQKVSYLKIVANNGEVVGTWPFKIENTIPPN